MTTNNISLVLYNIRSRFNVGAILRTADAAGVKKVYLCGITPFPPHPKINKVSLGAEKTVAWKYSKQTVPLIKKLKKDGLIIVALEQTPASRPYYQFKNNKPLALILGNEVKGLPKKILNLTDEIVEIPMHGHKESLNVAVAAGIVLFDLIKKVR